MPGLAFYVPDPNDTWEDPRYLLESDNKGDQERAFLVIEELLINLRRLHFWCDVWLRLGREFASGACQAETVAKAEQEAITSIAYKQPGIPQRLLRVIENIEHNGFIPLTKRNEITLEDIIALLSHPDSLWEAHRRISASESAYWTERLAKPAPVPAPPSLQPEQLIDTIALLSQPDAVCEAHKPTVASSEKRLTEPALVPVPPSLQRDQPEQSVRPSPHFLTNSRLLLFAYLNVVTTASRNLDVAIKHTSTKYQFGLFLLFDLFLTALVLWFVFPSRVDDTLSRLDWWISLVNQAMMTSIFLGVLSVIAGSIFYYLGYLRSKLALAIPSLLLCLLWGIPSLVAESEKTQITRNMREMLAHRWVSYDPPDMNSFTGQAPSEETLRRQLKQLHEEGGFDGVITYLSQDSMKEIPRIAKEVGFKAVIMGVYIDDLNDDLRIEHTHNAIAASQFVDAYCLGHHVPTPRVDMRKLAKWMSELRNATGRPVTTTFPIVHYLGERGKALREMGDFYFPDVGGSFRFGTTPEKMFEELRQTVEQVSQLPRDKPVLLKTICYPSSGAKGLSEDAQYEFYERVFRELNYPDGVYVSLYNAYDLPLRKLNANDYMDAERFVGLFSADGKAKRVVSELLSSGRFPVIAPYSVNTPLPVPMRGTVHFTNPKGAPQHQPFRARYFKVPRKLVIEWDKPEQELILQFYQRNVLQWPPEEDTEKKSVKSGIQWILPAFDGKKGIRSGEPVELKAWLPDDDIPLTSIWIWIE